MGLWVFEGLVSRFPCTLFFSLDKAASASAVNPTCVPQADKEPEMPSHPMAPKP